MKKLIAMIGAVAMAFGLYADGYGSLTYSPAGLADGTKTIVGYADDAETPYSQGGTVDVHWWSSNCTAADFEQPATVVAPDGGTSYLQIETEGTPMLRTFNQINANEEDPDAQTIEPHGLFVDMKVQLTGFEPDSEIKTGDGNKLLVWLKAGEVEDGGDGVTNLMVTCGYWDDSYEVTATNYELVAMNGSALDVKPGDWVHFTVRANKGENNVPTFNIYVNQEQVKAKEGDLLAFPSLVGGDSEADLTLKAAGFEGNGAIQNVNLYGQANAPAWAADPTYLTLVWDEHVTAITIGGVNVIDGKTGSYDYPITTFGEDITATITYETGYCKKAVTPSSGFVIDEDGDDVTFQIAQYGEQSLTIVSKLARDGAALVIDGVPLTGVTFPYVADAVAYLVDESGYQNSAKIIVKENDEACTDFGDWSSLWGEVTLDLNGKTIAVDSANEWTGSESDEDHFDMSCMILNVNDATITITNSVEDVGQLVGSGNVAILCNEMGTVYLTSANIKYDGAINSFNNDETFAGNMTIFGGQFKPKVSFVDGDTHNGLAEGLDWVELSDGWWKVDTAEPPPPGEKGFMIMIGETETYFDYLQDAIDAAKDGDTITAVAPLLTQKGVFVAANKFPTAGLTIDLAGLDYIVDKPGAGDSGTETQAFHFKSGNIITIKDGQISCPASMKDYTWPNPGDVKGIARMLNNYGTLTLENVDIDASNMAASFYGKGEARHAGDSWAVSAAKTGDLTLTGGSSITSREAVEGYASYAFDTDTGVSVTLNDATIYGDVQLAAGNLTLTAGTIDGELVAAPGVTLGTVTKSADFDVDAPAGWFWDNNVLAKCAAEIDGTYYNTLAAAFTAAEDDDEIVLLKDVELEAPIKVDKKVTLNIGDFDVTPKAAFTRPTGSKITIDAMFAVRYGGDFTVVGGEGVIDSSAYPTIYSPIKLTEYGETSDGTLRAKLTIDANLIGYYYAIVGNGTRGYTDITVDGGSLSAVATDTNLAIYNPQANSTVTINNGVLTGLDSAVEMRGGTLTVNGGMLTATSETYVVAPSGSGNTTKGAAVAVSQHTTKGDVSVEIVGGELVGLNAVSVANPQGNDSDNVEVALGKDATYNGALAFSADGNATVEKDPDAEIAAPQGYRWNENGVLVKLVTATFISEGETVDTQVIDAGTAPTNVVVTKEGYTFTGWDPEISAITEDTEYMAQFEIQMLTLTVKEVEHTTVEVKYDGTTDTTNGVYTLAYGTEYLVKYTPVAGYKGDSTHQGTLFDNTMVNQPKPTAIVYNITYVFNGVDEGDKSKVVNENPETYTIESETITFVNASCEGYTFKGWDIAKIDAGSTGDKTITGTFEKAEDPLPPWVPSGEKEAYNTWKTTGPGATESDFTGTDAEIAAKMEDSFLLNCAPTEAALQSAKANFKITSITKDTSGNWVVLTVGQEDNTAYGNGLIKLEAFESVGCTGTPVTPGTQPQLFWKASLVHPTAN